MEKNELITRIQESIEKRSDIAEGYNDLLGVLKGSVIRRHDIASWAIEKLNKEIAMGHNVAELYGLYKAYLLYDAPACFDSFMQYIEIDREASERFWLPRRSFLLPVANAMQDLAEDNLDELFLSMPPRCGKTTLMLMFYCWIMGRDSELSNLYCSYTDIITKAFYRGLIEIMTDADTYHYAQVFPEKIARVNALDETIDVKRSKHYPSMTCRSIDGTLNGACDARGIVAGDDLVSGIEEALSPGRLESLWRKVDNNLIPRAKEQAKLLWIGTRWSIYDPQGRRREMLNSGGEFSNIRFKTINIPALNYKDESNFNYMYGVGFSTRHFHERRASFEKNNDIASWAAQYMGEPIEREGTLFMPDDMRYYSGVLPPDEPDRIFMVCDPAFGGGDFVSAPVIFQYDEDLYIHDVVFDASDKKVTQPKVASLAIKHDVSVLQIEANKSTRSYATEIGKLIKDRGGFTSVVTKPAPSNSSKQAKIFDKAPDIRDRMIFRSPECRTKEYGMFMQNLFAFKLNMSKHRHDDAPDSLAQAIDFLTAKKRTAQVGRRLF